MELDRVPGVYTTYEVDSDISNTAPNNRCLLPGLMLPAGTATPGVAFRAQSLQQVSARVGGLAAQAARLYRAARAQKIQAELWILPLSEPAGGVQSKRLLTFMAKPVWSAANSRWELGTNTTALESSQCYIDVAGQVTTFGIKQGEDFSTIAISALAVLQKVTDLVMPATRSGAEITLTDVHHAAIGEDTPIRVWFTNPACGVAVRSGTLTLANNAAGGDDLTLTDGIGEVAYETTAGRTPAQEAPGFAAAINAANLTVLAAIPTIATGVISLFHRDDRWVRRFTAASADGTMTNTLASGQIGSGVPLFTGTGGPLERNSTDQAYKAWAMPFSDTTSLGAVATQIINQDKTPIEKGQMMFTCISLLLPDTSLPGATTPALTTSELFCVGHFQGCTVRAGEIAARMAAEVAGTNDYGRNYNGLVLKSTTDMPLSVPNKADQSTREAWNAAIADGYAPITGNAANQVYVVHCRTTFAAGNNPILQKSEKWSGALLPIYFRADLRQRMAQAFMTPGDGKSIKLKGKVHTNRGVTPEGVRSETLAAIKDWDRLDYYDYAPDIDPAVQPQTQERPTVIVLSVPFRNVADLDQLGFDAYPA